MDIKTLQKKVDETKALFILVQRVIPFVEDLFAFIGETTPLLEEINNTIKDNLQKMPNATRQLTKVTKATEIASTEIMDTVDRVNEDLHTIIKELEELKIIDEQILNNPLNLLEAIAEGISAGKDLSPLLADINLFINRMKDITEHENAVIINNIINKVTSISNDANSIINSLQIQDITAQQLAAVNHLLENIQSRLSGIMLHIEPDEKNKINSKEHKKFDETIKISKLHRDIAFDPEAVDSIGASERQNDVDALFDDPENLFNETTEEIEENTDKLMSDDNYVSAQKIENSENTENTTNEEVDYEEFSQDDIDALFN